MMPEKGAAAVADFVGAVAGLVDEGEGAADAMPQMARKRARRKSGQSRDVGVLRIKGLIGFPSWSG